MDVTMNRMRESVIAVVGLVKHFGPVKAVDGIDLHVDRGDIYALLGLNGAGKTTAIRMLLGMIAPTEGEVHLFGTSVRRGAAQVALADVWARTGYLVETPAAYPDLSVLENLHLTARLRRLNDGHRGENAVTRIMDELGLNEYAQRKTGDLSLGNAQRLGIAKALIHQPDLLILDEPANGLDPAGVVEIRQLLQRLAAQGTAILLSSHILGEVARLATRIGVIHHGRILTELAAADVDSHVRH
jgi:ABC-2 type transport system ATP-binding protein